MLTRVEHSTSEFRTRTAGLITFGDNKRETTKSKACLPYKILGNRAHAAFAGVHAGANACQA